METAGAIVEFVRWWGIVGVVTAAVFLTVGIDRIDENASGAYVFRPLLIPGVIVIWPLVLWRWLVLETGRDDWAKRHAPPRRAHGRIWIVLAILIPAIFITAQMLRQSWPAHYTPVRIEVPGSAGQ
jgi:hypothetical protein